jgi:hypothetical protein
MWANLGNYYFRQEKESSGRALDEMEAQRGARPSPKKPVLQKTLRTKPCDWIYHRLPLENPASHRKANCCVDQMHLSHIHPQSESTSLIL